MDELISPKYLMQLIKDVNAAIRTEYRSNKEILLYIEKWHVVDQNWNNLGKISISRQRKMEK